MFGLIWLYVCLACDTLRFRWVGYLTISYCYHKSFMVDPANYISKCLNMSIFCKEGCWCWTCKRFSLGCKRIRQLVQTNIQTNFLILAYCLSFRWYKFKHPEYAFFNHSGYFPSHRSFQESEINFVTHHNSQLFSLLNDYAFLHSLC